MRIYTIASESVGTRSMATYIETKDTKIIIDPGVDLAKKRYGLPPHPIEKNRKEEHWKEILRRMNKSEIAIITHYHYDHFNPFRNIEAYSGKLLLIKNPIENINRSQKGRAKEFLSRVKKYAEEMIYADNREFFVGNTRILFSKPVFHGKDSALGYVIEVLIDDGDERFIFTSDVQGPVSEDQLNFILENEPNIVYLDGPITYIYHNENEAKNYLDRSFRNILRILSLESLELLIIDHHFLRDLNWSKIESNYLNVELRKKVMTVAEFTGKPIELLEARRIELWRNEKRLNTNFLKST